MITGSPKILIGRLDELNRGESGGAALIAAGRSSTFMPKTRTEEMDQAAILRDKASRRLTGAEYALCCWVADGLHRTEGEDWRVTKSKDEFQALCVTHSVFFDWARRPQKEEVAS